MANLTNEQVKFISEQVKAAMRAGCSFSLYDSTDESLYEHFLDTYKLPASPQLESLVCNVITRVWMNSFV